MPDVRTDTIPLLRTLARKTAERAHVPFSGRPEAAVLLLSDGTWIPGVRVESASFSLLIPALLNAFSTAAAVGRRDVVAAVLSRPARPEDRAFLQAVPPGPWVPEEEDAFVLDGAESLPTPGDRLSPFLDAPAPESPRAGIRLAREVARQAYVPESDFRVGCVLELRGGSLVPGANVEHTDWSRTLCAERNALGTALSYGLPEVERVYLTCLSDPAGTPCGACRQVLAELAPEAELWMDRGEQDPEAARIDRLLPGFFTGQEIARRL